MKKLRLPLALVIFAGLIVSFIWWNGRGDEGVDDEAKPLAVTRQVERRTLTRELQISGTLERVEVQTISVATRGNISDIAIEDGDRIEVGDVIFSLDGRPGIAVQGTTPFFRDLDVGSRGPDVGQMEQALTSLGYEPGVVDDLFTLDTRRALAEFQKDRRYPAAAPEVGETITLNLMSNPVGYSVGPQNSASITIDPLLDLDASLTGGGASVSFAQTAPPEISIQTSSLVADEGSPANYTVIASAASTTPVVVSIGLAGTATPGADFNSPVPAQVTIPAGQLSESFTIQTVQDGLVEVTETVVVTVLPDPSGSTSYTAAAAPNNSSRTDILDDDLPVLNLTSSGTVIEGQTASFTISADQAPLVDTTIALIEPLTAGIGGGGGEATADTDYDAYPSVVVLRAGTSQISILVNTVSDSDVEGDEEIVVEIEASGGYTVGAQSAAIITIQDSSAVTIPVLTIEAVNDETNEGTTAQFTIEASSAQATPYDVFWTIGGEAIAKVDYEVPQNLVTTIGANATQANVNLTLIDNDEIGPDRTITLTLVGGAGYTVGIPQTVGVLIEDEDVPELTMTGDSTITEGQTALVTITADQPDTIDISIPIQIGGNAQSDADFEPIASRVTLPAGATTTSVSIISLTDSTIEPNEEVTVAFGGAGAGAEFTTGNPDDATVTILDGVGRGQGPILTINSSTADTAEGQQVTFTIGASVASTRDIDVNVSLGGSATNNVDFTFPTQDLILRAGQTQIQIPVSIRQDDIIESDKTIQVALAQGAGYAVAQPSVASATIIDDDIPELTVLGGNVTLAEGANAAFIIRADQAPREAVSINYQVSGSAVPGQDFETVSGTAILHAGETEISIPIRTLNDDVIFRPTDMIAAEWPGRAGKIFIEEGQSLVDGAPLFEITEDDFSIRLNLSPNQRAEMSIGMIADVEIDASDLVTVGDVTDLDENATVDPVTSVETYSGRIDISTNFPAVDGSQARVTVVIDEAVNAVVVPVAAVFRGVDGDAVRVLNLDDGSLNEVQVVTGLDEDSFVEIKEGLAEGDLIIIEVN